MPAAAREQQRGSSTRSPLGCSRAGDVLGATLLAAAHRIFTVELINSIQSKQPCRSRQGGRNHESARLRVEHAIPAFEAGRSLGCCFESEIFLIMKVGGRSLSWCFKSEGFRTSQKWPSRSVAIFVLRQNRLGGSISFVCSPAKHGGEKTAQSCGAFCECAANRLLCPSTEDATSCYHY